MNITKQQLEQRLTIIEKLIEDKLIDEACEKYIEFAEVIKSSENNTDKVVKA